MRYRLAADDSVPLRDLAIFVVVFFVLWSVAIALIWKENGISEPFRPWLRTVLWISAVIAWVAWQQIPRPGNWLGLVPISAREMACSVGAFAIIFGWNELRIRALMAPASQLSAWTLDHIVWSFIGVFVEELVFRGVIQTQALKKFAPHLAILGTAVLFLAVHVPGWIMLSMPVNAIEVATVLVVGLISGWLRWATGSLWPAVAAHWANNLGAAL